jgi:hypothetical protein
VILVRDFRLKVYLPGRIYPPRSGMTNANMKLVIVGVSFPGELELPKQKLEPGESIVRRVVELAKLNDEIKGLRHSSGRWLRTNHALCSFLL